MKLATPRYSNNQINEAGDVMLGRISGHITLLRKVIAHNRITDWRSSHAVPLRVVTALLRRHAKEFDLGVTVSWRLKRMRSLLAKLERQPGMRLSSMQDIGGCRAVLETIDQVHALVQHFRSEISGKLNRPSEKDYIATPKEDGYRSVHLVVRYRPKSNPDHPERKIEIQIRSRLQHEWATAVETVDLFTGQTLKTGGGKPQWKRFFALVAGLFAHKEGCPPVPIIPVNPAEVLAETRLLWAELQVSGHLNGWSDVMHLVLNVPSALGPLGMYLVELDVQKKTTTVKGYFPENIQQAQADYAESEKQNENLPHRSSVLVSVESLNAVKESFPSYYGDTKSFLMHVLELL
jgi:hypothetical protein